MEHNQQNTRKKVIGQDQSQNVVVPIIKANELKIFHPPIGKGSFGKVYRGNCRGNLVAVKVLDGIEWSSAVLNEFTREIEIMARILHPNILLCMGACTEEFGNNNYSIIMEYMPRGNLHTILHDSNIDLSLPRKLQFGIDICQGMAWLAEANIWHRDLKPANVLVDQNWNCKICDFGLSQVQRGKEKRRDKEEAPGSVLWMAPEVLLGENIDGKLDVYSYGLVLWEIITREELFAEYDDKDIFTKDIAKGHKRPSLDDIHPAIQNIITAAWQHDSANRPSFSELITLLDKVVLDIYLPKDIDNEAEKFWIRIEGKLKVPLLDFTTKIIKFSGKRSHITLVKCIEALLSEKENNDLYVSVEKFSSLIKWFGTMKGSQDTILDRLHSIMMNNWFFGDIKVTGAEELLNLHKKNPGTFLVRLNMGGGVTPIEKAPFTISRITEQGEILHTRVYTQKKADGFYIRLSKGVKLGHKGTLTDFINALKIQPEVFLQTPCPGWPYKHIFTTKQTKNPYQEQDSDEDSSD